MGKDWKYIVYLVILVSLLLIVVLGKDKQYDWQVTYAHDDKNPFGANALDKLLPSIFEKAKVEHRYKTFYELRDSISTNENVMIIAGSFTPDKEDAIAMMNHVEKGGVIFVSANYIRGTLADTLGLQTHDYFFDGPQSFQGNRTDTASLQITNSKLDTSLYFHLRRENIHNYLGPADTVFTKSLLLPGKTIAKNDFGQAVAIRINWGKGYFIFSSTPMVFTNIYLLNQQNHVMASSLLSYLPKTKTYWTEYYHLGRMEAATPLRFILTHEPLSWAYYISVLSLLVFLVFESKRRQRIIPVVKPLTNTSLDFIGTISKLFFEKSDHKSIATKKILYFLEQVRSKFYLTQPIQAPAFAETLAHKTGANEKATSELISQIHLINQQEKISKEDLLRLNKSIQLFWEEVKK
jgi:hypothetical protein